MNGKCTSFLLCLVIATMGVATTNAAPTVTPISLQKLDQILCPAELLVLRADVNKYFAIQSDTPIRRGLNKRIGSALSTLPLLCRRYVASATSQQTQVSGLVDRVRQLGIQFRNHEQSKLVANLDELLRNAPFNIDDSLFDQKGGNDEQDAKDTYEQYCEGCHSVAILNIENPAYSLKETAKTVPKDEFLARMLLGIRGTPEIGLSNPLTLTEIGAMRRFFLLDE